jgi:Bax protein
VKIIKQLKHILKDKNRVYASIIIFLVIGFILAISIIFIVRHTNSPKPIISLNISSADSIINIDDSIVPPLLYSNMPDLKQIDYKERKQHFINIMLPTILIAQKVIEQQRDEIIKLRDNFNETPNGDSLLVRMMKKFKAKNIDDLIIRMHPHPVSITLAQAAVESGWGTSRFCREANNLFGIWSFNKNEKRVAAGKSRNNKTIYLRKYDSLIESVVGYIYTIGSSNAFSKFRETRLISQNPYRLIWHLNRYSEKRLEYIVTLRNTIEQNNLTQYDNYRITKMDPEDILWMRLLKKY